MKHPCNRNRFFIAIGLAVAALATGQVQAQQAAQEQSTQDPATDATVTELDRIVVTAERRSTALMSTAISASVLTREDL